MKKDIKCIKRRLRKITGKKNEIRKRTKKAKVIIMKVTYTPGKQR